MEVPPRLVAVTTYGGNDSAEKRRDAKEELLRAMEKLPAFRVVTGVWWAQFDAPFRAAVREEERGPRRGRAGLGLTGSDRPPREVSSPP